MLKKILIMVITSLLSFTAIACTSCNGGRGPNACGDGTGGSTVTQGDDGSDVTGQ